MSDEQWRRIPDYSNYEVSDGGAVRNRLTGHVMSQHVRDRNNTRYSDPLTQRYLCVSLVSDSGRKRVVNVHRLVMLAFEGPCPDGLQVRHINGNSQDNRHVNLEYATAKRNARDILDMGRHRQKQKTHCPRGHEYAGENLIETSRGHRQCRECDREFSRRGYRNRRARLSEKVGCPVCGAGMRTTSVMRHARRAHPDADITRADLITALGSRDADAPVDGSAT